MSPFLHMLQVYVLDLEVIELQTKPEMILEPAFNVMADILVVSQIVLYCIMEDIARPSKQMNSSM